MSAKQHHIQLEKGDVGRYVLLPGDPGRCEVIAKHLDNAVHVATNREYVTYTGYLDGVKVSVTSTGIGCPSATIAVEGIQPGTKSGDLAIVSAAIRDEGTSSHYMPMEFPAIADLEIVTALRRAAQIKGVRYRVGITQSKDSFYGEVEPERSAVSEKLLDRWRAWEVGGAICSEMEASAIFIIASMLKVRAGGIMAMHGEGEFGSLEPLIETAILGVRELIKGDADARR